MRVRAPLVGREAELATLLGRLELAAGGQGGVVLLSGDPGIGKTRLLRELGERAAASGWRTLYGRAYDSQGMPVYLPIAEALAQALAEDAAASLPALDRYGADLLPILPEIGEYLPASQAARLQDPDSQRYRLFEGAARFFAELSRSAGRGLLLCLDDLHWAEAPTLRLAEHLARRLAEAPALIVCAFRPDLGDDHPLQHTIAELHRERLCDRLTLAPLSEDASTELVAGLSSGAVAPAVSRSVYRDSAGVPFFIEELVQHLLDEGLDLADAETATARLGVPEGVRQIVARRLTSLSAEANLLLQAGSVLGEGFRFDTVGDIAGIDLDLLLAALDDAVEVGVLRENDGRYYFAHALIRQTLYERLSPPRRQLLHLRAAEALEAGPAVVADQQVPAVALHYHLAGIAGATKAIEYAVRAADTAAAAFAWEEAVAQRTIALELLDPSPSPLRGELLVALGESLLRAGERAAATQRFGETAAVARALMAAGGGADAATLLGRAALGCNGGGIPAGSIDQAAIELLEEALGAVTEEGALRARLLAGLASALYFAGPRTRVDAISAEAVAVARRSGDVDALVAALWARYYALWTAEHVEERLRVAEEIMQIAAPRGNRELVIGAAVWRMWDLLELGDFAASRQERERTEAAAEELRQPLYRWYFATTRAMDAVSEGRFEEAERLALAARDLAKQAGRPDGEMLYTVQLLPLRWLQGRFIELLPAAQRYAEALRTLPTWRCMLAHLYSSSGLAAKARREFDALAQGNFAPLAHDLSYLSALVVLAETCVTLQDTRRAEALYELLLPFADRVTVIGTGTACYGSVERSLGILAGLLGHWDTAEAHFGRARAVNDRLGAVAWAVLTDYNLAAMLLQRARPADRERAQKLLRAALAAARAIGMGVLTQQAEVLTARWHEPPPNGSLAGNGALLDQLTARELEVLRLLAGGLSAREIADRLVLTTSTVNQHTGTIYRKLDVRGRGGAIAYALQHGIAHE